MGSYTTCALVFNLRKRKTEDKRCRMKQWILCWEASRKCWNIISCAFCSPSTQEVNQCHWILLPFGVSRSQNTTHMHTRTCTQSQTKSKIEQKTSHTVSTPLHPSAFFHFTIHSHWITLRHWKPPNHYTNTQQTACLSLSSCLYQTWLSQVKKIKEETEKLF